MSHLISSMQLWIYPTIALVLFLAAFAAILVRVFHPASRAEQERSAAIPFDETPTFSSVPSRPAPVARSSNP